MPEELNDEILILDESGEFKLLSGANLKPYHQAARPDLRLARPAASVGQKPSAEPVTSLIDTGMEEKMLQPPPPVVRSQTASFYFHPSDEEEVAKIKPLASPSIQQKKYSLDKIIAKLAADFKLNFSPDVAARFRNLSFNYLRDRKTEIETAETLKRPMSEGGLALTLEATDHIIAFLKEVKVKVTKEQGLIVDEKMSEESPAKAVMPPAASSVKPAVVSKPLAEEIKAPPAAAPKETLLPLRRLVKPMVGGKVPMGDVQKDYKLVGPLEELNSLSLTTFRRLAPTSAERAGKIFSKIDYLGKESLVKKAGGIKAWRESPLYKMYLAIGQASLEHSVGISEIIKQYQAQGEEIITMEEFEAVGDLNRKLRF